MKTKHTFYLKLVGSTRSTYKIWFILVYKTIYNYFEFVTFITIRLILRHLSCICTDIKNKFSKVLKGGKARKEINNLILMTWHVCYNFQPRNWNSSDEQASKQADASACLCSTSCPRLIIKLWFFCGLSSSWITHIYEFEYA